MDCEFDEPAATYLPPASADDRADWLRLIRSRRVGPTTFHRLMAAHGTARAALAALPEIAAASGVSGYEPCPEGVVRAEMAAAARHGARLLCRGEDAYPTALALTADAPPVLWVRGQTDLLMRPIVAVVGARNASSLGLRMARRMAEGLAAAGYTVVSGLARGIDAEAHRAALPATAAVLAGGIDNVYPPENKPLFDEIGARGLLMSEQPPGLAPQARHFPLRNRIVAGLARAVVVVEAAAQSGSLLTARAALDLGREVLAVPGHPFDARAEGCNQLIRDGATLARSPSDVIAVLGGAPEPARIAPPKAPSAAPIRRPLADISAVHRLILDRLGPSPLPEDQLIRDLDAPAGQIAAELVTLEMEGQIRRAPGGLLSRG